MLRYLISIDDDFIDLPTRSIGPNKFNTLMSDPQNQNFLLDTEICISLKIDHKPKIIKEIREGLEKITCHILEISIRRKDADFLLAVESLICLSNIRTIVLHAGELENTENFYLGLAKLNHKYNPMFVNVNTEMLNNYSFVFGN